MCRLDFCIIFLTSVSLNLAFSPNSTENLNLRALPEKLLGVEPFTNETEDFYSSDGTNKVDIKSYPYMAGVIVKQVFPGGVVFEKKCTGAFFLYTGGVITAAHCVVYGRTIVDPNSVLIRFNSNYLDRGGKTITVISVEVDKLYFQNENGVTIYSDIANIKVNNFTAPDDVNEALEKIEVLPYPSDRKKQVYELAKEGITVSVIGYGITKESRKDNSLAEVSIHLIPHDRCRRMVSDLKYKVSYSYHVCAYTRGVDVCRGEGGAIMQAFRHESPLAIWSYGRNCGKKNRPAFFAVMVPYRLVSEDFYQYSRLPVTSLPKYPLTVAWEEVIEKEYDDEGKPTNAPGGELADASNGAHLSRRSTVSTGLCVIFLIVEITILGISN